MAYWSVARTKPNCERKALHFLRLASYETYAPRLRERRTGRDGRRVEATPFLFPGYLFILVELQWVSAEYVPGMIGLVKNGVEPARVPDRVIDEIRGREHDGYIMLPKRQMLPGTPVRVLKGPFSDHVGFYAGQAPRERITVLLQLLGSRQRVELPSEHAEPLTEPGDEQEGLWSRAKLLQMDQKFAARMQRASDNEKCAEPIGALIRSLRA